MAGIETQIVTVAVWLILIKFLQVALYPAVRKPFGNLAYGLSFGASIVTFSLAAWYLGLLHLPVQLALVPFIALLCYHAYRGEYRISELRQHWIWDAVFLFSFAFALDIRFFNPTISFAEKFMDHAFLASIMRNPVVSPLDPWFAGGTLDTYYYLGHWIMGSLGVVTGGPSTVVFNLMLPTVFALAAVSAYAIGKLFLSRFSWLPVGILFLVNPSFVLHLLSGTEASGVLWESTRTIANTINEYPIFSFLWGDPHAHVLGLFNQIFLIALLAVAYVRWRPLDATGRWMLSAAIALSLGSMPGINTWDVLVYAPVVLVFLVLVWSRHCRDERYGWVPLAAIPPLSIAIYLPFLLMMQGSGILGVYQVLLPSDPLQFLLVHGFFIAVFIAAGFREVRSRPYLLAVPVLFAVFGYAAAGIAAFAIVLLLAKNERTFANVLAVLGLAVITFCELLYIKDGMGDTYFRMNTVFKFYYSAWVLMGIAALLMVGSFAIRSRWFEHVAPRTMQAVAAVAVILLFCIPAASPVTYGYAGSTLDGSAYLAATSPDDYAGIMYLRSIEGDACLAEAPGDSYTYYGRVSSFTGIPAILGWGSHEYVWRGNADGWYGERVNDLSSIYEDPEACLQLLDKYGCTHLYVGDPEREKYDVRLPEEGLTQVFEQGSVRIYQRNT